MKKWIQSISGLSLIELLISATIMLAVFAMVFTAFIQTRKISLRNQMDAELIQNARIGLDEMARTIRMTGYRRDRAKGQAALLEAAPFQIIFNADLDENASPSQRKESLPPGAGIKLYDATEYTAPMHNYTTGAETYRWTLDTNDDGIVDQRDTNDNVEERSTRRNPNDMVLIQEINGGSDRQIALEVLGPYDVDDQPTYILPMFQYWLLEADRSFSLLGDTNGDHQLTGEEYYFRSITSQMILKKVRRIRISVTTESDGKDPIHTSRHRRVTLSSEVNLRNVE